MRMKGKKIGERENLENQKRKIKYAKIQKLDNEKQWKIISLDELSSQVMQKCIKTALNP